jgi:hypothetical protein
MMGTVVWAEMEGEARIEFQPMGLFELSAEGQQELEESPESASWIMGDDGSAPESMAASSRTRLTTTNNGR